MARPNLENWETLASLHATGSDRIYDADALVAGREAILSVERTRGGTVLRSKIAM